VIKTPYTEIPGVVGSQFLMLRARAGTSRRPTYSVKLRLWKVSTFYFKIVATRQTYDADYHDSAARIDAPRSHGEFINPHHGVLMSLHNMQ